MSGRSPRAVMMIVGLLGLACTCLPLSLSKAPVTSMSVPTSGSPAASVTGPAISDFPAAGRLAVQGHDGNLYVLEAGHKPLIVQAGTVNPEPQHPSVIQHPTWSPDGWLSYVVASPSDGKTEVKAVRPGTMQPVSLYSTSDNAYVYGYWSPVACAAGPECGRFAFLSAQKQRIALHMAEVTNASNPKISETTIGYANPFYFSWAPDGHSMFWFQDGSVLKVFDVESHTATILPDQAGSFHAPAWSPVDQRLLFARGDLNGNQVTIADGGKRLSFGTASTADLYFMWSPDGQHIAYASGDYPLSGLTVNSSDGTATRSFSTFDGIVSFFWSPDSKQLAVVILEDASQKLPETSAMNGRARSLPQQGAPAAHLVWSVANLSDGKITRLATFLPTDEQFYLLRYFDQFAQSHRVWSPDSRYLVYADAGPKLDDSIIYLLDTTNPSALPLRIMQGKQAIFSFNQ